jgi:hypothetical protein
VLLHMEGILDEPHRWTRVALGRSSQLETVLPLSGQAVSWSLSGALALALYQVLGAKMIHTDWVRLYDLAVDALWAALSADFTRSRQRGTDLDAFNDYAGTHYADLVDLLERAIDGQRAALILLR